MNIIDGKSRSGVYRVECLESIRSKYQKLSQDIRTPHRIGALWDQIIKLKEEGAPIESIRPLLGRLGVSVIDIEAQNTLLPLMTAVCEQGVKFIPSETNSGVYQVVTEKGEPIAFFKAGSKRVDMELKARKIAHQIGLGRHVIPGVACTIANPLFPQDPITGELWNGLVKVHTNSDQKKSYQAVIKEDNLGVDEPFTLTGILEPVVNVQKKLTAPEIARMTVLAIILGLRDAKLDGIAGSMFFDIEDYMPDRFLLAAGQSPNKSVASLHLPYLAHPAAKEKISSEELSELINLISSPSFLTDFLADLRKEKIEFADLRSEQLIDSESNAWDDGNCPIEIERPEEIMESYSVINIEETDSMFSDEQLVACGDRIRRLKRLLGTFQAMKTCPTTLEIVSNVDPMYGGHLKALETKGSRGPSVDYVGRYSPSSTNTLLSEEDRKWALTPNSEILRFSFSNISVEKSSEWNSSDDES